MEKEIKINGEFFGLVETWMGGCDFNIPIQKEMECGMAYLREFEITDFAECRGLVQLEESESDVELWFFDTAEDEVIKYVFKGEYAEIYESGVYLYERMTKDSYIPTEFVLKTPEYDDEEVTLKFVAWTSKTDGVTVDIAKSSNWEMLIDMSEALASKFPTLENIIKPDIYMYLKPLAEQFPTLKNIIKPEVEYE